MSKRIDRTGEKRINNAGEEMVIIEYRNNKDIDVQFSDGRIAEHMAYSHFIKGDISGTNLHRAKAQNERIGARMKMKCGLFCEVIEYRSNKDITVLFENGYKTTCRWNAFIKGEVRCHDDNGNVIISGMQRVGERVMNNQEEWMEIISYRNASDIDVKFDCGPIVKHACYSNFINGGILCPGVTQSKTAKQRLGETNTATNGQLMTIVDYYNWKKVTVKFEDGTLVETAYNQFKLGKVTNPNKPVSALNDRTGYSNIMENGLKLTVTNYRITSDLDATFEDGAVVTTTFQSIVKRHVAHPNLSKTRAKNFHNFNGSFAWSENEKTYYTCECSKCGFKDILTPQQMIEHSKEHDK